jgi:hypothetical protein
VCGYLDSIRSGGISDTDNGKQMKELEQQCKFMPTTPHHSTPRLSLISIPLPKLPILTLTSTTPRAIPANHFRDPAAESFTPTRAGRTGFVIAGTIEGRRIDIEAWNRALGTELAVWSSNVEGWDG